MWQKLLTFVLAAVVTYSTPVTQFRLGDTEGRVHAPAEWRGQKAILLFFVAADCPVGNSYVPEMNRIARAYSGRRVRTYAVQADPSVTAAATAVYARDYHFEFPVIIDPGQILVRLAGATVTPQAAILSPDGKVLYRGRIDNRVADFGSQRSVATAHDVREALDAVVSGRPPRVVHTRSIGCAITLLQKK